MAAAQGIILECFVRGVPYARSKTRGGLAGPKIWTSEVIEQTAGFPSITGPCSLDVEFVLPAEMFPADFPLGTDLDNLLKRLLDSLGQTILRSAPGGDSAIVALQARKRLVREGEETGARIVFRAAPFPP